MSAEYEGRYGSRLIIALYLACLSAGSISQTLTYPFDVLRRKMQVTGMGGQRYNGALDALQSTLQTEGPKGLYRGLWPNLRALFRFGSVHRECHADFIVLMLDALYLR